MLSIQSVHNHINPLLTSQSNNPFALIYNTTAIYCKCALTSQTRRDVKVLARFSSITSHKSSRRVYKQIRETVIVCRAHLFSLTFSYKIKLSVLVISCVLVRGGQSSFAQTRNSTRSSAGIHRRVGRKKRCASHSPLDPLSAPTNELVALRSPNVTDEPSATANTPAQLSLHVLSHVDLRDRQHTITSCETFSILSSMSE